MFGSSKITLQNLSKHWDRTMKGYPTPLNDDQTYSYGYPNPRRRDENSASRLKYVVKHGSQLFPWKSNVWRVYQAPHKHLQSVQNPLFFGRYACYTDLWALFLETTNYECITKCKRLVLLCLILRRRKLCTKNSQQKVADTCATNRTLSYDGT